MFRRNVLGLLQCNRRLTRPYAVNRRSASSSSSQLPPNPKTVEEIPSLVSQIRESFSHGDGAFYGVSAVGFVSAALLLERWSSSTAKPSSDYLPHDAGEHGEKERDEEVLHDEVSLEPSSSDEAESVEVEEQTDEVEPEVEVVVIAEDAQADIVNLEVAALEGETSQNNVSEEISGLHGEDKVAVENLEENDSVKEELAVEATDKTVEVQSSLEDNGLAASEEVVDENECPFCTFMKGGACKKEFISWEKCIDEAKEMDKELHLHCIEETFSLKTCMEANEDYYYPALAAGQDEDENTQSKDAEEKEVEVTVNHVIETESPENEAIKTETVSIAVEEAKEEEKVESDAVILDIVEKESGKAISESEKESGKVSESEHEFEGIKEGESNEIGTTEVPSVDEEQSVVEDKVDEIVLTPTDTGKKANTLESTD